MELENDAATFGIFQEHDILAASFNVLDASNLKVGDRQERKVDPAPSEWEKVF